MSDDEFPWRPWQVMATWPFEAFWYPYVWGLIEIRREGQTTTQVVDPRDLPPEFNVYGLYWRPWAVVHPRFDGP